MHRQQNPNARAAMGESWNGAGLMTARRHDCSRSGMTDDVDDDDEDDEEDGKVLRDGARFGERAAQGSPTVKAQRSSASTAKMHRHRASSSGCESRDNDDLA